MLRIDKEQKRLVRLERSALADADHWERHLQSMICADSDSFCAELGEDLLVLGEEVRPSDAIPDRIDILAIDEAGNSVVIELKRGTNKLQLLQAISYAGMISKWPADRFVQAHAGSWAQSTDDARTAIEEHTGTDLSAINQTQRVILIAEDFDPALLIAAEWLHERFDVDIRCYRLQLSREGGSEYLTCTCIYPPIEIASLTRRSGDKSVSSGTAWINWDEALNAVENAAVRDFYRTELAKNQESRLPYREIIYRIAGKRRVWVSCRKKYAYVWQWGRFEHDEKFWASLLSEPNHVRSVAEARALRFHLTTPGDFKAFSTAIAKEIPGKDFSEGADMQPPSSDD